MITFFNLAVLMVFIHSLIEQVLVQHPANLYAANGAAVILAEKGQFDVSKDIFTQVRACIITSI